MNMLCKPHDKGPRACVTTFMSITFSFWVSWVDYLGSQSSQSPEQSSYCWTLDGSECSLYLSLPHEPDFVSFGVPVHKWSLLFLPLSTSGLYLISHLITVLSERWESWGKTSNPSGDISFHPFTGLSETIASDLIKSHPSHTIPKSVWWVGNESGSWEEFTCGQDLIPSDLIPVDCLQRSILALSESSFVLTEDIVNDLRKHWLKTRNKR